MKSPLKKIVTAIIFSAVLFNGGFSFAQNNEMIFYHQEDKIQLHSDNESSERKREFWEKFRQSVTPREKPPPAKAPPPREVKPREEKPREEKPREEKPREVQPSKVK